MLRCVGVVAAVGLFSFVVNSSQVSAGEKPLSWDGFSVSVGGGAGKVDTSLAAQSQNDDAALTSLFIFPISAFFGTATGDSAVKKDDWEGFGTLQLGYDKRFGNLVIGALADYDFYPDKPTVGSSEGVDGVGALVPVIGFPLVGAVPDYAQLDTRAELKGVWSVGGRLGVVVTPSTLIYGLGGYTQARIDAQADLTYFDLATGGQQTLTARLPDRLNGYFLGAGGEIKVADNIALKLEYRYANYKGETRDASVTSTGSFVSFPAFFTAYNQAGSVNTSIDTEIHTVRGALVFQLGQP